MSLLVTNDARDAKEQRWLFRRFFTEVSNRTYACVTPASLARFEEVAGKAGAQWTVIRANKRLPGGIRVERRGGPKRPGRRQPLAGV